MTAIAIKFSPVNIEERRKLDLRSGDTVRVSSKIQEKGKTRLQAFEGTVIGVKHGKQSGATFTVYKVTSGVGVEKVYPLYSPVIEKIEILRRSKVRRATLYYITEKVAREVRRKMKHTRALPQGVPEEALEVAPLEEVAETSTEKIRII
jgi:large subunit ribosomal protein L19